MTIRRVERAILLIAGRSRRFGNLTVHRPKCLLEVGGISILERALRTLSECGVSEAIFVVGYKADQIRRFAGTQYAGLEIRYVVNDQYAETNTAYSLWLARRYLASECLLIEGDILFDSETLQHVLGCSHDKSIWTAMPVTPGNDEGILLRRSEAGYVAEIQLLREGDRRAPTLGYKCAGIQLLTTGMVQTLASKLNEIVASGQVRVFADLVLGESLTETSMWLCSLEGLRWAEVDDLQDLQRAEQLFPGIDGLSIGGWRNPFEREVQDASTP